MKINYDKNENIDYIYIKEKIATGEIRKTYLCNVNEVGGFINLDFDNDGKIVGIEILNANQKLPAEILK